MSNRQEILELLSQGKITADEAAAMLGQAKQEPAAPPTPPAEEATKAETAVHIEVEEETAVPKKESSNSSSAPSWFHVRVRNMETGKNKVSVNIPLRMFKFGLKLGRKFTNELDDLNWDDIDGAMSNMQSGMIVEVQDEESNEHVQVFID